MKDRRDFGVDSQQLLFLVRPVGVFFVLASDLDGVTDGEGLEERVNGFLTKGKLARCESESDETHRALADLQRVVAVVLLQPAALLQVHLPVNRTLLEYHDVLRQRARLIGEQNVNLKSKPASD